MLRYILDGIVVSLIVPSDESGIEFEAGVCRMFVDVSDVCEIFVGVIDLCGMFLSAAGVRELFVGVIGI